MDTTTPSNGWSRVWLALGLVFLSPLCAEYIIGYDNNTGQPGELLVGLLFLGPLYGCPALLIRELARRFGVGWPGIVALSAAFGILQAGVIDQSMFSESYRQIDYWDELVKPTWIPLLGISGHAAMLFVLGHVIWSFCIPIALMESLNPAMAERPWLRRPGLAVTTALYLAAAALILREHLVTEQDHASRAQVVGSLLVATALAALAFTAGRRRTSTLSDAAVPAPSLLAGLSLVASLLFGLAPATWPGVAVELAVLGASAAAIMRFSRSDRWSQRHVAALAMGALLARAIEAFPIVPLGDVPTIAKYAHNVAFLLGALLLGAWAIVRNPGIRNAG